MVRFPLFLLSLSALLLPGALSQMESCRSDGYSHRDPGNLVSTEVVDLDLQPEQRWIDVVLSRSDAINDILAYLFGKLPRWLEPEVVDFLNSDLSPLVDELGDYGREMVGVSKASGLPLGKIVAMNIMYEAFTVCTSVVAVDAAGDVVHGRNLDFGLFFGWNTKNETWELTNLLRPLLVNVNFTRNGGSEVVFQSTQYAGYVGVLSGMSKHFSVTIDDRFALNGGFMGIIDWFRGDRKEKWVSLLTRELLETGANYTGAVASLKSEPIVAPVYYIVGGSGAGEGSVVTRARNESLIFRSIGDPRPDGKSANYVVETNYDWDKPSPFYDARRPTAVKCLDAIPEGAMSLEAIFGVLTTKPVLNALTTYTILMSAKTGRFEVYKRFCTENEESPYPCSLW